VSHKGSVKFESEEDSVESVEPIVNALEVAPGPDTVKRARVERGPVRFKLNFSQTSQATIDGDELQRCQSESQGQKRMCERGSEL
jgi:hypothetical protein